MDFKQNIKIGSGPREVNNQFYSKSQRTVFGMVLYYIDPQTQKKTKHHINYISDILSHDGLFIRDVITYLNSKYLVPLQLTDIKFWTDCGPHFHSLEILHYMMIEFPTLITLKKVEWNLFEPYHGKNPCDAHFSLLSRWLKDFETRNYIYNTQDLIHLWKNAVTSSAKRRDETSSCIKIDFIPYTRDLIRPATFLQLHLKSIKKFLYFSTSALTSNQTITYKHSFNDPEINYISKSDFKITVKDDKRITKRPPDLKRTITSENILNVAHHLEPDNIYSQDSVEYLVEEVFFLKIFQHVELINELDYRPQHIDGHSNLSSFSFFLLSHHSLDYFLSISLTSLSLSLSFLLS